ncbi:MAG TPA: 2-enoyl thioester reductase domain-containing protein [Chthoniobacterales bacterium]|nr:2-enoyl thioester reductase domain-containing protein [Chthoniobacterales bacterium]
MSGSIKAIVYHAHGKPEEVLRLEEQPLPQPAPDEALVRMLAAPINPADLNAIEGKYPIRPELPATPGMEGAGVVVEIGARVRDLAVGTRVILPHNLGTWREACVVAAEKLVAVPDEIEPAQAAMLKINPLTAWRMLHDFVALQPGDWVIQNAANSAAGRAVIHLARELGYRTINVVRRTELIEELRAEGGDVVLLDDDNLRAAAAGATAGAPIRLALNAVGGESALRLAKIVAPEATIVTYGAMSLRPLTLPNGLLIFKNLHFTGFWINKWYEQATPAARNEAFARIFAFTRRGLLQTKIEHTYPLGEFRTAVARAAEGKRGGKIIFCMESQNMGTAVARRRAA